MSKLVIKELIVVEGKNDSAKVKQAVDAEVITTSGLGLTKENLDYIKTVAQKRGVIILTDPDIPGEKIRTKINQTVPGCKNAFLTKSQAQSSKKIGVEHASITDIQIALKNMVTYQTVIESLSYQDFIELGLSGSDNSQLLRAKVSENYHLGVCNGKTLWKRLNLLQISKQELEDYMRSI
jgi:ribonuclease M5